MTLYDRVKDKIVNNTGWEIVNENRSYHRDSKSRFKAPKTDVLYIAPEKPNFTIKYLEVKRATLFPKREGFEPIHEAKFSAFLNAMYQKSIRFGSVSFSEELLRIEKPEIVRYSSEEFEKNNEINIIQEVFSNEPEIIRRNVHVMMYPTTSYAEVAWGQKDSPYNARRPFATINEIKRVEGIPIEGLVDKIFSLVY